MRRSWLCLFLFVAASVSAVAQPRSLLRVSANGHYLQEGDQPFFWLGDTAWELFHRLNREQADYYLKMRAAQGFTVIQACALAEFGGLRIPNAYGDVPLRNQDPQEPVEAYWKHVDWIVRRANELRLYIGLLPTWGDKWNRAWGEGPEIFTPENAEVYGEWLGRRYRNDPRIVWILGGDRKIETEEQLAILRAMARGLRRGDGGEHLITFHPTGGRGSSELLHGEPWLDFHMRQNGHGAEYNDRYEKIRSDWELRDPVKPVLDGEPVYEDHPLSFRASELSHSVAADVRRALYWDLFSGACGHTYGHHSVWQMYEPGGKHPPVNSPLLGWREALEQPGARQMAYARRLLESRPFLTRIPDDSVIVPDRAAATKIPGAGRYRFAGTRDSEGTYLMIYAPVTRVFSADLSKLPKARRIRAWWLNPRTGIAERASPGDFENPLGAMEFRPPSELGEALDWVLVLDDAARNYPPPGGLL